MSGLSVSDDRRGYVVAMMGRTAAGKTTTAKRVAAARQALYVSEAAFKRALRPDYTTKDSLDEALRDLAYTASIAVVEMELCAGRFVVLDASFHKAYRRKWLYEAASRCKASTIILYCRCDNVAEVQARIGRRRNEKKTHENHADAVVVYDHIDRGFEDPTKQEFMGTVPIGVVTLDTESNTIAGAAFYGQPSSEFAHVVTEVEATCAMMLAEFATART